MQLRHHVSTTMGIRFNPRSDFYEVDHYRTRAQIRTNADGTITLTSGRCSRTFVLAPGELKELEQLIEAGNIAAALRMFTNAEAIDRPSSATSDQAKSA